MGEDFEVRLGDWVSRARIDRPDPPGPVPAVVLVHGTGPRDLGETVTGSDGAVRSRIFAVRSRIFDDLAWRGDGGLAAKEWVAFVAPRADQGGFTPDRRFDPNGDDAVDLRGELAPALPAFVDTLLAPGGPLAGFGPGRGLPSVTEQAPFLPMPVLAVQGANDGNVPPDSAHALDAALARAGNRDHTVRLYPGLGHSLGDAASPADDDMRPIRDAPLADLADWLHRHA